MNISFFLDAKLIEKDTKYYTSGAVTKEYLNKHRFSNTDKLIVVARKEKKIEPKNKLSISSDTNIEFVTFYTFKEAWKKRKIIKEIIFKSQFVNIKLPSNIGIIAMHYVLKYNKMHIVEMVGCPFDALYNHGSLAGKILAPIMYCINKYYIKKAHNVVYVTDKFLQKRYPNRNNNIGCSDVNIENIHEEILEKRLKKISNLDGHSIIKIGLIGSINVKYKGHETAIKAISRLKDKYNVELHFLGTGEKENFSDLVDKLNVRNNVYFDGTLPSGEPVYDWIDNLDIYIIPSLTEGLPRSLVEAMSRACPCIGTKVGGIIELLPKEMLIKKKDYFGLSKKIEELLSNKELTKKLAIENFEKAKSYKKNVLLTKKKKFYNRVLEGVNNEKSTTCGK